MLYITAANICRNYEIDPMYIAQKTIFVPSVILCSVDLTQHLLMEWPVACGPFY